MKLLSLCLLACLAQGSALAAGQCGSTPPDATVELRQSGGRALLHYSLSRPAACFDLVEAGKIRKLTWKVLTPRASLSADGNAVLLDAPATSFHVEIAPFERDGQLDRVYSPLIAFGDGSAVAVYNRYLAGLGGRTSMRFEGYSPLGSKAGAVYSGENTYLIVGRPSVRRNGASVLVADRAAPAWLAKQTEDTLRRATAELESHFTLPRGLTYLLTYTDAARPGAQWRGDTSAQLVRLNVMGALWQTEDPARTAELNHFIYHELFHTVNHGAAADAVSLLEGGAEAAALTLRYRAGEIDDAAFRAAKDAALMRCLSIAGATLAQKERSNTRLAPYACGESVQYLATQDIMPAWRRTVSTEGYGWPHFLAALEAPPEQGDLLASLVKSQAPVAQVLEAFALRGVLRPLTAAELEEPAVSGFYARMVMNQALAAHCKGRYGTYFRDGIYTLDAPADSCSGLPDKFPVASLNGHGLRQSARSAFLEYQRRCADGKPATLEDGTGKVISLTCAKPQDDVVLYRFTR